MKPITRCFLALACLAGRMDSTSQTIYTNQSIPANAEIFGAGNSGLPDSGGTYPPGFALPANPGVLTMLSVTGLITLNSGLGHNNPDGIITSGGYYGPTVNGANGYTVATTYGGISGITIPGGGALVGVFEPATGPTGTPPVSLNFNVSGINFTRFAPQLFQTFFIGDGLTGNGCGSAQQFIVPAGATRLFLGISDAPGFDGSPGAYGDNSGAFTASFEISGVPRLQWPQMTVNGDFAFSFQSVSNVNYLIESTTNLVNPNWITNNQWTGDGSLKQIQFSATNSAQFFRIGLP